MNRLQVIFLLLLAGGFSFYLASQNANQEGTNSRSLFDRLFSSQIEFSPDQTSEHYMGPVDLPLMDPVKTSSIEPKNLRPFIENVESDRKVSLETFFLNPKRSDPQLLDQNQQTVNQNKSRIKKVKKIRKALASFEGERSPKDATFEAKEHQEWIEALPQILQEEAVVVLKSDPFVVEPADKEEGFDLPVVGEQDYYLQFYELPSEEQLKAFAQSGVAFLRYLTNRTYHVFSDLNSLNQFSEDPSIMGVFPAEPVDRLAQNMAQGNYIAPILAQGSSQVESCQATVHFELLQEDLDYSQVVDLLSPYVESIETQSQNFSDSIDVTVKVDNLIAMIGDNPKVSFVDDSAFNVKGSFNLQAAKLAQVDKVQPQFDGFGQTLALIDSGRARSTHQELAGRITFGDNSTALSNHATHVAGTIGAGGANAGALGMAFASQIYSYQWDNWQGDLTHAGNQEVVALNNSWGYALGWYYSNGWKYAGNTHLFGKYTSDSVAVDTRARNHPHMQICWSAGNDRSDVSTGQPHDGTPVDLSPYWVGGGMPVNLYADLNGPMASAKSALAVGALNDDGQTVTYFSSWGPADDGRVKPDLSANGETLNSSLADSDTSYGVYSGTSMAAPVVTGVVGLLNQAYQDEFSVSSTRSDVIRSILIHSAKDLYANNGYRGPDLMTGYGAVDAKAALDQIQTADRLFLDTVANGENKDLALIEIGPNNTLVKATLSWTDVKGSPSAVFALKNNLDLVLVDSAGHEHHHAWLLDRFNFAKPAEKGINKADTTEKVELDQDELPPGTYTLRVKGETVPQGPQDFALVLEADRANNAMVLDSPLTLGQTTTIKVKGIPGAIATIYYSAKMDKNNTFPGYEGTFKLGGANAKAWIHDRMVLDQNGEGTSTVHIKNFPKKAGKVVHSQAVIHGWGFTDVVTSVVQPAP